MSLPVRASLSGKKPKKLTRLTDVYLDFWTTKCRFMGSSSHHGTGLEISSGFARPGISEGTIRVLEAYETQRSWRRGFSKKKHMWHGNPVGWPSKLNPVIFHIFKEQLLCLVGKLDSGAFNKASKLRSTSAINALFTLDYLARAVLSETNPPWTIQDTYEKWQSTRLVVSRLALELFDESHHASWRNSVNRCWW